MTKEEVDRLIFELENQLRTLDSKRKEILPISWKGTLAQYAGRLHRLHYNKNEVRIYDYVNQKVPMLERMYKRRLQGYLALGYETEEVSFGCGHQANDSKWQ